MQEEACRHTLSALHTMMRHAVHRALFGAHSTIVGLISTTYLGPCPELPRRRTLCLLQLGRNIVSNLSREVNGKILS